MNQNATQLSHFDPSREVQIQAFLHAAGWDHATLYPLVADASFRRYIRVTQAGQSAMLMDAPPGREDVRPYLAIARHLHTHGYSTPAILAEDAENGFLLLEDLGDDLFTVLLVNDDTKQLELYRSAIQLLAQWHKDPVLRRNESLMLPSYDHALLLQETSLFTDWFLPATLGAEQAKNLREEYLSLWRDIFTAAPLEQAIFVHRDFHASNLIWLPERKGAARIGLLDFQDAVWGDPAYDLVSLLEDARRDVSQALAETMLNEYIAETACDSKRLNHAYGVLAAQRNCKIIGIFARLYLRDNKPQYLAYMPRVWAYLERDLTHPAVDALKQWMDKYIPAHFRGELTLP